MSEISAGNRKQQQNTSKSKSKNKNKNNNSSNMDKVQRAIMLYIDLYRFVYSLCCMICTHTLSLSLSFFEYYHGTSMFHSSHPPSHGGSHGSDLGVLVRRKPWDPSPVAPTFQKPLGPLLPIGTEFNMEETIVVLTLTLASFSFSGAKLALGVAKKSPPSKKAYLETRTSRIRRSTCQAFRGFLYERQVLSIQEVRWRACM